MLSLDHLPFGALDVGVARAEMQRLGFTTTANAVCRWTLGGRQYAADSISVVFDRAYLDFIEVKNPAWRRHLASSEIYAKGLAPSGVVLAAPSFEDAQRAVRAAAISTDEPYAIRRELPGATPAEIDYRIFSMRAGGLPLAVIEDAAPHAMRREDWMGHANCAAAITRLHLRVAALEQTLSSIEPLWSARTADSASADLDLGGVVMTLHESPHDAYLERVCELLPHRDRTSLLAIEFSVSDPEATRAHLRASGTRFAERDEAITVEPGDGYGCGFVFRGS